MPGLPGGVETAVASAGRGRAGEQAVRDVREGGGVPRGGTPVPGLPGGGETGGSLQGRRRTAKDAVRDVCEGGGELQGSSSIALEERHQAGSAEGPCRHRSLTLSPSFSFSLF